MAPDFTLANFLKELGARLAAAAVVLGVFFGLGYLTRTDVLGLSALLGNQAVFFATAFSLVGVAAAGWMALQQYRG
jgi:hypothetical protein